MADAASRGLSTPCLEQQIKEGAVLRVHQAAIMKAAKSLADMEQKLSACSQWQAIASGTKDPA